MIEMLKSGEWSKADVFLLPLTGLAKSRLYEMKSYLFWNEYSIENYNLIICLSEEDGVEDYLRNKVFPILDKKGYLLESYNVGGRIVLILDMSEWAMDIHMFLSGKYSKLSQEAKNTIRKFHMSSKGLLEVTIHCLLYPTEEIEMLGERPLKDGEQGKKYKTAIEYAAENYELDINEFKKVGEIGSVYDRMTETLITNIDELCKNDTEIIN